MSALGYRSFALLGLWIAIVAPGSALAQSRSFLHQTGPNESSISVCLWGAPVQVLALARQLLREQGYALADSTARGRLVTVPSFRWPAWADTASWHGRRGPGVILRIFAEAGGGDTVHFAVTGIAPVDSSDAVATRSAEMLRKVSAVIFVQALMPRVALIRTSEVGCPWSLPPSGS
jgi:hypothetical protein